MSTILELKDLPSRSNDEVWYIPASNAFRVMEVHDTAWKLIKTRLMLVGKVVVKGTTHIQVTTEDRNMGRKWGTVSKFPPEYKYYDCVYTHFNNDGNDVFTFFKI